MRAMLPGRVRDLGVQVDLAEVLPAVAAVLHPTRYDAAANLVLEALASGVPVVTTAMDGSAEIVPVPGWVALNPREVGEVSRCLTRALAHGERSACREAAESWPDTRNYRSMEAIASRCMDG